VLFGGIATANQWSAIMKTLILALTALGIFASSAMAADGTIKSGGFQTCPTPKSCGAGYDPLKKPHVPVVR
jgi:hypothetical protein